MEKEAAASHDKVGRMTSRASLERRQQVHRIVGTYIE